MTAPDRPTPPPSGAAVAELLAWLDALIGADRIGGDGAAVEWANGRDIVVRRPPHAAATLRGLLAEVEALRAVERFAGWALSQVDADFRLPGDLVDVATRHGLLEKKEVPPAEPGTATHMPDWLLTPRGRAAWAAARSTPVPSAP